MTWHSLGSLALPHEMHSRALRLRHDLQQLSHEVTTGRAASPHRQLRGDFAPLAAIEHRLGRIETAGRGLAQRQTRLDFAEATLGVFLKQSDEIAAKLRLPLTLHALPGKQPMADRGAAAALSGLTAALNQKIAGQRLFAGTQTDRAPLPSGGAILAAAENAISGLQDAAQITAALEAFFMDEAGGFMTTLYRGGAPVSDGRAPSGAEQASLPTAADPAIRQALMALTMAGILAGPAAPTDTGERRSLELGAAVALDGATARMAALGGFIGFAQAEAAVEKTRLGNERDALLLARETMIGADPYAAATRLEQTRGQLESLYMVTARLARLSLTEFLR